MTIFKAKLVSADEVVLIEGRRLRRNKRSKYYLSHYSASVKFKGYKLNSKSKAEKPVLAQTRFQITSRRLKHNRVTASREIFVQCSIHGEVFPRGSFCPACRRTA